ncbi:acylamino-acid-releasing enzyme-like isoform X1 [Amphiura filiformis]|uniref:acylamino-acid-releasing enzyme-like isoform X1 n=1 Tax=Amphiura filiformis TaxID=82378 RepID=UPI003B21CA02
MEEAGSSRPRAKRAKYYPPTAMDKAATLFRQLAKNPSVVRSHLHKTQQDCYSVSTVWSQRDLERGESVKFNTTHVVFADTQKAARVATSTESQEELLCSLSPSRKQKAIVQQVKNKKGDEKQYLEIWGPNGKEQSIDLEALDKHGKVYDDDYFSCLEWSSCETQLVYIAEKKQPKKVSYFDPKKTKDGDEVVKGTEHEFLEDWGETLVSRHHPVICIMDLTTETVKIVEGIDEDMSPGQVEFAPGDDGVVFICVSNEPYRVGVRGMFNMRSAVYYADLKTNNISLLSASDRHVRSVRFSPDRSKFVYLCNDAGGPHWHCSQLMMYDWATKENTLVVHTVMLPDGPDQFPGIYCVSLPKKCWADDNERIFLPTAWRSKEEIVMVNTSTRVVTRVTNDPQYGCWVILDMYDGMILATRNSPNTPPHLVLGQVPSAGEEHTISWQCLDSQPVTYDDISWEIVVCQGEPSKEGSGADVVEYECILLKPSQTGDEKPPLIVFPHGGPHCVVAAEYILSCAFFCKMGYAILIVNFRGSLGFGQAGVLSLPGKVGSQDVKDVHGAALQVLSTGLVDKERVVVMGGSHGGFLSTHLIGQYPGFYKACCVRNPVVNIASLLGSTDIPDWSYVEAGLEEFKPHLVPTAKTYKEMLQRSPIAHVDKVKTPILLMIGAEDRRVPPKQGYEYYKAVKARGVQTKLYVYPGNNHSLSKVDCEGDCMMNMYQWFMKYL